MLRYTCLAAAFAFAACSNSTTKNTYQQAQEPVSPKGTLVFQVRDGSTHLPLEGAKVTVVGGSGASLTTDATGTASYTDAVVNSSYTVIFEKDGYLRQSTSSDWLSGSTGNSPLKGAVDTTYVELFKADAQLKGAVFFPDGSPASGVTVSIDQSWDGAGESVLTAQTGADGTFSMSGLASYPSGYGHQVLVYPPDLNGDGLPDFEPVYQYFSAYPGQTARVFFDLYQSNITTQRILASNVMAGSIAPGADLKITFANPVLASNLDGQANQAFTLTDQVSGDQVALTATWSSATQVSLKPGASLAAGARYALAVNVTSAHAQTGTDANFFQTIYVQVRPDGVAPISTQVTSLLVENPYYPAGSVQRAQFDWFTNPFQVSWNTVAGATRYVVFVKDTKRNPDWVQVATETASGVSRQTASITLPAAFDLFPALTGTQPLAQGNTLTFAVAPVDVYGYLAPVAAAPTVTVSDNTQPTIVATITAVKPLPPPYGVVDAINDDALPASWQFRIGYSEPMDPASPPVFSGNGNPQQLWQGGWEATSPTTGIFVYTLTLTIPPMTDASGKFLVRGGKDVAGNVVINGDIQSTLSGLQTLNQNPTFEDATGCQLTGWSATNSVTMPVPSAVSATGDVGTTGAGSRCAAVLGATANVAAATGLSRISQDFTLPSIPTGSGWTYKLHADLRGAFFGPTPIAQQVCQLTDTSDAPLVSLSGGSGTFATTSVDSSYVGTTTSVRLTCKVDNTIGTPAANNTSLYVDNIAVYLFKLGVL